MDVLMKETLRPSGTSLKKGRTSITGNFVQIELLIAYNLIGSIEPRTSRMSPFKGTSVAEGLEITHLYNSDYI